MIAYTTFAPYTMFIKIFTKNTVYLKTMHFVQLHLYELLTDLALN